MTSDVEEYSQLNKCTNEHGIVIFGQNFLKTFPLAEMAYKAGIHTDVYNRSLPNRTVTDMADNIDVCITELNPDKVFVNIGEYDISDVNFDLDKFVSAYSKMIYSINIRTTADIYLVSVMSDSPLAEKVNAAISKIAEDENVSFINVGKKPITAIQYLRFFDRLKCYMRDCPITFGEAFS